VIIREASSEVLIRSYRETDEESVAQLWSAVFQHPAPRNVPRSVIAQKLAIQRELLFVAEKEGSVVGTAMAEYDGHRGWLYTVAVRPDVQRRGIGRALVQRAEESLAALGCPKVNLQVMTSNAAVVGFYERLGYVVEERISMGKAFLIPAP
jgi:ribosomal protein S18 acetylase RimI-like enzyme